MGVPAAGLLVDPSTTSFNLQPSLVVPVDVLDRGDPDRGRVDRRRAGGEGVR